MNGSGPASGPRDAWPIVNCASVLPTRFVCIVQEVRAVDERESPAGANGGATEEIVNTPGGERDNGIDNADSHRAQDRHPWSIEDDLGLTPSELAECVRKATPTDDQLRAERDSAIARHDAFVEAPIERLANGEQIETRSKKVRGMARRSLDLIEAMY